MGVAAEQTIRPKTDPENTSSGATLNFDQIVAELIVWQCVCGSAAPCSPTCLARVCSHCRLYNLCKNGLASCATSHHVFHCARLGLAVNIYKCKGGISRDAKVAPNSDRGVDYRVILA